MKKKRITPWVLAAGMAVAPVLEISHEDEHHQQYYIPEQTHSHSDVPDGAPMQYVSYFTVSAATTTSSAAAEIFVSMTEFDGKKRT